MLHDETGNRKITHLDSELERLKSQIQEMGQLVQNQLKKSILAITRLDKDIAREVIFQERRVNAEELKIDRDCENIMALFNPVAIDLRLVFATFKINSHLERIGDNAKGIARYAVDVLMDEINKHSDIVLSEYLKTHPEESINALHMASVIHKLERIGDLNKNIAEEIIFFVEANVLKNVKEKI